MRIVFKDLYLGDLKIKLPIIQGGMGVRVSSSSLAAAVSNENALGVIAAVGLGEECGEGEVRDYKTRSRIEVVNVIRATKRMTKNAFGVNIMCALTNYDELVDAAQNELVDVIISGAGLPLRLPALIKNSRTKLVPIVSSARAAHIICSIWQRKYQRLPDAIIVEGPLAGGHLGFSVPDLQDKNVFLDKILEEVLGVVHGFQSNGSHIPVIAAGGIFDGKDIARVLRLGASGVQMATRFVCTTECDVSPEYKEAYLSAKESDIVVIESPVGMPARVINNSFVKSIREGNRVDFNCEYRCLSTCNAKKATYCIAKALLNAYRGDMSKGFAMCGTNAYRIKKIVPVKELIEELVKETELCLAN